jgi:hypothetical protein
MGDEWNIEYMLRRFEIHTNHSQTTRWEETDRLRKLKHVLKKECRDLSWVKVACDGFSGGL